MLLLFTLADAQELPWVCPPISVPADATVYRDTDAGLADTFRSLRAAAEGYVDEGCAWVETTTTDERTTTTERTCTSDAFTVTTTAWEGQEWEGVAWYRWSGTEVEVASPVGEPWTRLLVHTSGSESSTSSWSGGGGDTLRAEWDGVYPGLPAGGWFQLRSGVSYSGLGTVNTRSVDTSGCSWAWDHRGSGEDYSESVSTLDRYVSVYALYLPDCPNQGYLASIDGVAVGAVDYDTWVQRPDDADLDGVVAACDCDDADATVSPLDVDVVNDGIDQDCDGTERVDADVDDDGYASSTFDGDDCDDADETVHPHANDRSGDGIDSDCDGADDVDADDDGYTADGDDRQPDCDDTDATISPTDRDIPCDGIDQDCDGADDCPPPSEELPEKLSEEVADADGLGCRGGAAWLAFLPAGLLARRRRRFSGDRTG